MYKSKRGYLVVYKLNMVLWTYIYIHVRSLKQKEGLVFKVVKFLVGKIVMCEVLQCFRDYDLVSKRIVKVVTEYMY